MGGKHYGVFSQARAINREEKEVLASREVPLYTQDSLQDLLNSLRTSDSRKFGKYDISRAIEGTGMRGDEERFRQKAFKGGFKRNLFTENGIIDILRYHKGRLREYREEEVLETLRNLPI